MKDNYLPSLSTKATQLLTMASQVRQNYHEDSEKGINAQIELELYAFYTYLSMASYFDRDDVALHGFAEYFRKASHEEFEHAQKLMKFQNQRGGRVVFRDIKKPAKDEWGTGMLIKLKHLCGFGTGCGP